MDLNFSFTPSSTLLCDICKRCKGGDDLQRSLHFKNDTDGEHYRILNNKIDELNDDVKNIQDKTMIAEIHKKIDTILKTNVKCPQGRYIMSIDNFSKKRENGIVVESPELFMGEYGYKMKLLVDVSKKEDETAYLSAVVQLLPGEYDGLMQWPFPHQVVLKIINQRDEIQSINKIMAPLNKKQCVYRPEKDNNTEIDGWESNDLIKYSDLERTYAGFSDHDQIYIELSIHSQLFIPRRTPLQAPIGMYTSKCKLPRISYLPQRNGERRHRCYILGQY